MSFQAIKPQAVDAAALLATNVVETAPAAYNSGTTYALAATVSVAAGAGALDVYTSLQGSNTNHAPASSPAWWKKTGSTYQSYSTGATYAVDEYVLDPTGHKVFQSLQGSNTNHPLTDASWWIEVRASNRYCMFDQSNSSQTVNPDSIVATVQASGLADGVALANISAASVRVKMTDTVEGVVFDQTFDLVEDSGVDDFYPWFFSPPTWREKLPIVALPPYAGAQIEVSLLDPGYEARCGTCVIGPITQIGGMLWSPKVGFTNYSVIGPNDYGDRELVERGYTDDGDYVIVVDNAALDAVMRFFKANRATALLLQADDRWDAMQVFGIVTDCSLEVPGDTKSFLSLSLGGLT